MAQGANDQRADEIAIRDLIVRIGMVRSHGTPEEYMALFTPDAQWERRPGPDGKPRIDGAEKELAHARENQAKGMSGPGSHRHHVIPMTVADVDGDRAKALSQLIFLEKCDGKPEIVKMWILKDDLVRTANGWRVSYRRLVTP
jgi:hypothetical protein